MHKSDSGERTAEGFQVYQILPLSEPNCHIRSLQPITCSADTSVIVRPRDRGSVARVTSRDRLRDEAGRLAGPLAAPGAVSTGRDLVAQPPARVPVTTRRADAPAAAGMSGGGLTRPDPTRPDLTRRRRLRRLPHRPDRRIPAATAIRDPALRPAVRPTSAAVCQTDPTRRPPGKRGTIAGRRTCRTRPDSVAGRRTMSPRVTEDTGPRDGPSSPADRAVRAVRAAAAAAAQPRPHAGTGKTGSSDPTAQRRGRTEASGERCISCWAEMAGDEIIDASGHTWKHI